MRLMYDSETPSAIPADAQMVGGYVDGNAPWRPGDWLRFPRAVKVRIAVYPGTDDGHVFDGPPDNASWPQVVGWVSMRRRAGADPSVYTDGDQWPVGVRAFQAAGVAQPHWWIASWNGVANVPSGAVAHQYANVGDSYDLSAVLDYWPGVDPAPGPPVKPPAPPQGQGAAPAPDLTSVEDPVIIIQANPDPASGFGGSINLLSGNLFANITSTGDVGALQAQGVKLAVVSTGTFKAIQAASAALQGTLSGSLGVSGNLTVA